jgi:N-methylhydantoinase A
MWRIGVDVGGTFTDVVAVDANGATWVTKVPTTPNQDDAVMEGLQLFLDDVGIGPDQVLRVAHGTTSSTNALIERKGAKTALVTTVGFRDVLEIRRGHKPDAYDFYFELPQPLVPRPLRLEVDERIDHQGNVLKALDDADLDRIAEQLRPQDIEGIAVSFIFSFKNPAHERRAVEALAEALPECFIAASCDVDPNPSEWERTSTTVLSAYLGPVVSRYLERLRDAVVSRLHMPAPLIMQSNGGLAGAGTIKHNPVTLIGSGPAAAVVAAKEYASRHGYKNAIMCDMGGTSFDLSVIVDGSTRTLKSTMIEGFPIRTPFLETYSIGAGGGSIAWVDDGGTLRVGPQSAGAWPGPACYGRGGREPTVTDADLLLGHFPATSLMAGAMPLDQTLAENAMEHSVAKRIGLDVIEAAAGVLRIVDVRMADAIRVQSTAKGLDPRDFTLVVGGGAGPLHVGRIARELEIQKILVPPCPGNMSAFGCAITSVRHEATMPMNIAMELSSPEDLVAVLRPLESQLLATFETEQIETSEVALECYLDLRYFSQMHDLPVWVDRAFPSGWVEAVLQRFHDQHLRIFGFSGEGRQTVALVAARVIGTFTGSGDLIAGARQEVEQQASPAREPQGTMVGSHRVYLPEQGQWIESAIVRRSDIGAGTTIDGPCLIPDPDSTTLILPGQRATLLSDHSLLITEEKTA